MCVVNLAGCTTDTPAKPWQADERSSKRSSAQVSLPGCDRDQELRPTRTSPENLSSRLGACDLHSKVCCRPLRWLRRSGHCCAGSEDATLAQLDAHTHTHALIHSHTHTTYHSLVPTREEPRLGPRGGSGQTKQAEVAAGVIKTFGLLNPAPDLN